MPPVSKRSVIRELNHWVNRLTYSIARYAADSTPYTTPTDKKTIQAVSEVGAADLAEVDALTQAIDQMEGIPQTGLPDPVLAELNYLSYPYLLDRVIEALQADLERLEKVAPQLEGHDRAKALIDGLLKSRVAQIKKLTELRKSEYAAPEAASA